MSERLEWGRTLRRARDVVRAHRTWKRERRVADVPTYYGYYDARPPGAVIEVKSRGRLTLTDLDDVMKAVYLEQVK